MARRASSSARSAASASCWIACWLASGEGRGRRLAGDECQLLGEAVVQLAGDPSAILPRRHFFELFVGDQLERASSTRCPRLDQLVDARFGHGLPLAGYAEQALEFSVEGDGNPCRVVEP